MSDRYRSQGVGFLLINPNLQDDRDAVAREANFRFQMHYTPNGKAITD